jgi:hypothetical protein
MFLQPIAEVAIAQNSLSAPKCNPIRPTKPFKQEERGELAVYIREANGCVSRHERVGIYRVFLILFYHTIH